MDRIAPDGRFEVVRPLGRGSFATTLLAHDRERGGGLVALKILDVARLPDVKSLELFEREGQVLSGLRHQGIPAGLGTVRLEWEGRSAPCLIMEFADGTSLGSMIESGTSWDRSTVLRLFYDLVGILDYLHTRVPPVIHRDIKPANVIVRPDGSPVLVDFGSVRAAAPGAEGSTVAGTYGYMPFEQYMGQASPASDLYGLAATFLHLVTGRPPTSFMTADGRIEVPESLSVGEPLTSVIRRLLLSAPAARWQSAAEVRDALLAPVTLPAQAVATGQAISTAQRALGEGPRALTGEVRRHYRALGPNAWRLMNAESKVGGVDVGSALLIGFFSVLTFGVLPLWFWSLSATRRRRLRPFLTRGTVVPATVTSLSSEDVGFNNKLVRVRYQFELACQTVRGSDLVMPEVGERWAPGDRIEVAYLADCGNDSVIVSTA